MPHQRYEVKSNQEEEDEYCDNTFSKWFTLSCQNLFVLSINMSLLLVNFPA